MVSQGLGSLVRRYLCWRGMRFSSEGMALPAEYDLAYDTGFVFEEVMRKVSQRVEGDAVDEMLLIAARRAADETFTMRASAGVNPAHRNVVLAMQPGIENLSDLAAAAAAETSLTHRHPEALATAAMVALLARQMIQGKTLQAACEGSLPYLKDFADCPETQRVLGTFARGLEAPLASHRDGFSPLVLESALCFLTPARCFEEALLASLEFAGPDNFCPVLVGSLGGALFGCNPDLLEGDECNDGPGVTSRTLKHEHFLPKEHRERICHVAKIYAPKW